MAIIINRKVWGAKPPSRPMPPGTYPESTCFVHHEAGGLFRSEEPASEAARMREIQHYDMHVRGYADIPYSFGMFPSGRGYEGRDYHWDDSATGGSNGTSISIVFPGNYQLQFPTPKSLDGCAELIVFGITMGQLTSNCAILGHKEAPGAHTACPGENLMTALPGIRSRVAKLLAHTPPAGDDDVPKPTDIVSVIDNDDGCWQLTADGGVKTVRGTFYGSYPMIPNESPRTFYSFTPNRGRPGYTEWATDGRSSPGPMLGSRSKYRKPLPDGLGRGFGASTREP